MRPSRVLGVTLLAAALAACGREGPRPVTLPFSVDDLPPEARFLDQIDRSKGFRDCFEVIREPTLVPAAKAPRMAPDEMVIGLDLGDVQVAYPINLLNFHEIVEHRVAGLDLLVCW